VTTLATASKEAQERAESNFKKKELQAREASKAMAEYEAARRAERDKTARLKLLREAKEAADSAAAAVAKTAAVTVAKEAAVAKAKVAEVKAKLATNKLAAKKAVDPVKKPAKKRALVNDLAE
jgi:hypothetical protein